MSGLILILFDKVRPEFKAKDSVLCFEFRPNYIKNRDMENAVSELQLEGIQTYAYACDVSNKVVVD